MKRRHAPSAFDGEGARRYGGRWNSPGRPVVYASESRALATLEVLVGLRSPRAMRSFVLLSVELEESLVIDLDARELPDVWNASPPTPETQEVGNRWFQEARSVALRVPSSVVPGEFNFLLNPQHPEFSRLVIGPPQDFPLDPRLVHGR